MTKKEKEMYLKGLGRGAREAYLEQNPHGYKKNVTKSKNKKNKIRAKYKKHKKMQFL